MSEEDFSPFSGPSHGQGHADFENSSGSEGRGGDNGYDDDFEESEHDSPKAPAAGQGRQQTEEANVNRMGIFGDDSEAEDGKDDAYTEYTDFEDESAASPHHQDSFEVLEASTRGLDSFVVEPSQESLQEPSTAVAAGSVSVTYTDPSEEDSDAVTNRSEGDNQDDYGDEYEDDHDQEDQDDPDYSEDEFDEGSPEASPVASKAFGNQVNPVGRYVADVIERIAVRMWPDAKPKKKPADSAGQSQEAEAEDEIAAIIAASRAAVDRPAAASTSAMNWDDREMEAAAPSAGRHAVDFGPVGTPPPDDAKPGWLRDTSIQCGISCVLSEFQTPRQTSTPVFSPARPPRDKDNITPEVRNTEIQTQVSNPSGPHQGHLLMEPGSDFRRSISGPLETVDEGEREETPPTPPTEKAEAKAQLGQATQKPPGAGHSSETEASKPIQPRASSEKRHKLRETRSPQRSLSPVQPLRTLLPHEQEELYSGISQAPSSTLAFGRRLQGRRPTPLGAQAFSWSEDLSCDEPSAIIAPIPAGHLHRICDPFAKRARPVWVVNRSSTPRSSELRRIKPLPKGLESRPPESVEPDIRTEVHAVMAHRRAKDWLMADNLQLRNTATEQDFRKRGVAAGAVYYAKPSKSCLQSLGAGGNFPGGRR